MLRRRLFWPLFAALMGFALGASVGSALPLKYAQAPQNQQAKQGSDTGPYQADAQRSLWVPINPTEFFTIWVAAFTLALVIATGGLVWIAVKQRGDTKILQRAYIAVEPGGIVPTSDGKKCIPNIEIRNAGRLPARNVRWAIQFDLDKDDKRPKERLNVTKDFEGENTIPPDATIVQGGVDLIYVGDGPNELRRQLGLYAYVWGAVIYDDGFGSDRRTNFCHRYNCINLRHVAPEPTSPPVAMQTERADRGVKISRRRARLHRYGNEAT